MSEINDDYLHLALKLREAAPDATVEKIIAVTRELILATRKLQRLAENVHNTGRQSRHEAAVQEAIHDRIREILKPLGIEPVFDDAPDQAVLRLLLPRNCAEAGWGVPL